MSIVDIKNIALPPRSMPFLVRFNLLFGGILNQMGWLFFGFGLIFFWVFGANADITSFILFHGDIGNTQGSVIRIENTRASENGSPIYKYQYTFKTPDGKEHQGISYATGSQSLASLSVTIEYRKHYPSISRIKGMRRAMFGPMGLFVTIFPLIGLAIIIYGLKRGVKANRLLKHGKLGLGKLKSKEATKTTINNQRVYKLTFEFTSDDGRTTDVVTKTHLVHLLEDNEQERLLYDPYNPTYAVMLDNLPGAPEFDETGNIRTGKIIPKLMAIIIPASTIIGHGYYLYLKFFQ